MAILDEDEEVIPSNDEDGVGPDADPETPYRAFVGKEISKISTMFSQDIELGNIIHELGGYKLGVTYFLQSVDPNDVTDTMDINTPTTYKQYVKIDDLILYVQTPIEQSNVDDITFEAIIDAGIVPNMGDMCMFTMLGGREGIFNVTTIPTRKHYNNREVFILNFKLHNFIDQNPSFYNDLILKTFREEVYDKEFVIDQSSPLLVKKDYIKKVNLKSKIPELINHYFKYFLHPNKNVIALPTSSVIYTDTLMTEFLLKMINADDHVAMVKLTRINIDLKNDVPYCIWDVLEKRNINMLKQCVSNIGFKYIPFNNSNPITRNISYLNINYIANKLINNEPPVITNHHDISIAKPDTFEEPVSKHTDNDFSYVFNKDFYLQTPGELGRLETLVIQYIKNETYDVNTLAELLEEYPYWSTIQQYYYIPILLVLVRNSIMNNFKPY